MKQKATLIWQKAAVVGSLWASSEIVLGSFLHNLRVPFAGNFLTAIGIILLVSISRQWTEKGLIWRSGLVCALMKSISPSSVILGPMIAIFFEALLLELSLRFLGRNIIAIFIGAALAMSWNLFHKIINFFLYYGFEIQKLYLNLIKMAEKQAGIEINDPYTVVWVLLFIQMAFGIASALFGLFIYQRSKNQLFDRSLSRNEVMSIRKAPLDIKQHFSTVLLGLNFIFLLGIFLLMAYTPAFFWISSGAIVLIFWSIRYPNVLKRLAKPRFWILLFSLTFLSSFSIYFLNPQEKNWQDGLWIGLIMNFRAIVTIIGFAVIGKELGNPKLRNLFKEKKFSNVQSALEAAFDSLPLMISSLPPAREFMRNPAAAMQSLLSSAELWLERLKIKDLTSKKIILVYGNVQEGKTTALQSLKDFFDQQNIQCSGFVSPVKIENNEVIGYSLTSLISEVSIPLSTKTIVSGAPQVGNFFFYPDGLKIGREMIKDAIEDESQLVVVDEIGPWELQNQGWTSAVQRFLLHSDKPMIWSVRRDIVDKIIHHWGIENPLLIDVAEIQTKQSLEYCCKEIVSRFGLISIPE